MLKSLEKLTKEELIELWRISLIRPTEREVLQAKRNCLLKKADRVMEEAQKEMKASMGKEDEIDDFIKASDKFDKGVKLHDKVEKLYEAIRSMNTNNEYSCSTRPVGPDRG